MSEDTSLRITQKNKERFDQIRREEAANKKIDLTQDQAFAILLDLYEAVNITHTLKVTPK